MFVHLSSQEQGLVCVQCEYTNLDLSLDDTNMTWIIIAGISDSFHAIVVNNALKRTLLLYCSSMNQGETQENWRLHFCTASNTSHQRKEEHNDHSLVSMHSMLVVNLVAKAKLYQHYCFKYPEPDSSNNVRSIA